MYGSSLVCAIHVGSITDHGYNQAHHDGLQEMVQRVSGLRLEEVENVPESDAVSGVIDQLVDRGCQIIFGQSFGYLPYLLTAAERYPQVVFLHAGGHELRDNLGTYWANNYEAMYLAGIVAGATSKSGQLGFITAFPIPNILASVNAFELGARRVNPKVTTRLVINQAWVDPTKEAAATNALAAAGVDVVATIIDSPVTVVKTAEAHGMYVIGFHSGSLAEFAPKGWLTGVDYTWGNYYTQVVQDVRNKSWQPGHVRGGIESDMITLAPFGPAVSAETKGQVTQARTEIISGRLKIFQGPIADSLGKERIKAGADGGVELLDTTDWLVAGVSQFDVSAAPVQVAVATPTEPPAATATAAPLPTDTPLPALPTDTPVAPPTPAPTAAAPPTQPLTSTDTTAQPRLDFRLGYLDRNNDGCAVATNIIAQILRQNFNLTAESMAVTSADELFATLASTNVEQRFDLTPCYTDPDDRDFLQKHFGFVILVGGAYTQVNGQSHLILVNAAVKKVLQRDLPCVYSFLKQFKVDSVDLNGTDADTWLASHADLVRSWTRCQ